MVEESSPQGGQKALLGVYSYYLSYHSLISCLNELLWFAPVTLSSKVLRAFEGDPHKSEKDCCRYKVVWVGWAERALLGAGLPTRLKFRMVSARDGGWAKLNYLATVGVGSTVLIVVMMLTSPQPQQVGSFTHVSDSTLRLMPLFQREACSCWEGSVDGCRSESWICFR